MKDDAGTVSGVVAGDLDGIGDVDFFEMLWFLH